MLSPLNRLQLKKCSHLSCHVSKTWHEGSLWSSKASPKELVKRCDFDFSAKNCEVKAGLPILSQPIWDMSLGSRHASAYLEEFWTDSTALNSAEQSRPNFQLASMALNSNWTCTGVYMDIVQITHMIYNKKDISATYKCMNHTHMISYAHTVRYV